MSMTQTVSTTETTDTNASYTVADLKELFTLEDTVVAHEESGRNLKKLRDSHYEALIVLADAQYVRESDESLVALLGIDRSPQTMGLYRLAAKVMTTLVRDPKTTAKQVYGKVQTAHKTKEYRASMAEARLSMMPAGSTWAEWLDAVDRDIRAHKGNDLNTPLKAMEKTPSDLWTAGDVVRLIAVARRLGLTLVETPKDDESK